MHRPYYYYYKIIPYYTIRARARGKNFLKKLGIHEKCE
jgi:hypothetical protein